MAFAGGFIFLIPKRAGVANGVGGGGGVHGLCFLF